MMIRSLFAVALVVTLGVPLAAQGSHPSFAGTWVLDPGKTINNTASAGPDSATRTIAQHGDTLTIDTDVFSVNGPQHTHLVWGLDGKPWKNSIVVANTTADVSTVLTWDASTLVISSDLTVMGTDVTQVDRWTMSADGKSVSSSRTITQGGADVGSMTMTYVKKN